MEQKFDKNELCESLEAFIEDLFPKLNNTLARSYVFTFIFLRFEHLQLDGIGFSGGDLPM